MQTIYVPKYRLHYRVNPKDATELQWSNKPFGPGTQWQHAMSFRKPIRALDIDDTTQQGVVVLNDSSTYVGSGVRKWGRKFYPAGTRIFSLYAVGESKDKNMKKCSMQKTRESIVNRQKKPSEAVTDKTPDDMFLAKLRELTGDNYHYTARKMIADKYFGVGNSYSILLNSCIDIIEKGVWQYEGVTDTMFAISIDMCNGMFKELEKKIGKANVKLIKSYL